MQILLRFNEEKHNQLTKKVEGRPWGERQKKIQQGMTEHEVPKYIEGE